MRLALARSDAPAALALPGGRTAALTLPALAAADLDWRRVSVVPTDERWVAPDHPDSNQGLIARCFAGVPVRLCGLKTDAVAPEQALEELTARLAPVAPPFAATLLGMGEDGHFASIFPGAAEPDPAAPVMAVRRPDHPRVSLTPAALRRTDAMTVAVAGAVKIAVMEKALAGDGDDLPIRRILRDPTAPTLVLAWNG